MPELPDVTVYLEALEPRVLGKVLRQVRVVSPFLLRTFDPPLAAAEGRSVRQLRRIGKRIALGLDDDLWLILHLMIAGRLHWKPRRPALSRKVDLAAFDFNDATLLLTEAGTKRRASLHVVSGAAAVAALDPGGLEVLDCSLAEFRAALVAGNHTLKRVLSSPRVFSGIGTAYSDEILHRARLSPLARSQQLTEESIARLHAAVRDTMRLWIDRLRKEAGTNFPENVTAFREEMAVHGRYGRPCPDCGTTVQRIRYAENETNYCPRCQTDGKLLADRSLSRLLKEDWPKTIDEWER